MHQYLITTKDSKGVSGDEGVEKMIFRQFYLNQLVADAQAGPDPCWSQTYYVGFVVTRLNYSDI
jgi:hypothetical protein